MREIVDFMKELFLIKEETGNLVGLSSFRKAKRPIVKKAVKKKVENKELKLSDLMRRA